VNYIIQSHIPRRYRGGAFKRGNEQLILIYHIRFIFATAFAYVPGFVEEPVAFQKND